MKKLLLVIPCLIISIVAFTQTPSNGIPGLTNNTSIILDTSIPKNSIQPGILPNNNPGSIPGTTVPNTKTPGTPPNSTPGTMPGTLPSGITPPLNNVPGTMPGNPVNPPGTPANTPGVTNPPSR